MEDSRLCLTWNDHGTTYQQELTALRNENFLTDVTLACDGQKFLAHKLVLVTCSDFFKSLLGDVPCPHPIVYLRGVEAKEMRALIDFMYVGKIDFPKEKLNNLLSTAKALQIKGLGVLKTTVQSKQQDYPISKRKRSLDCNEDQLQSSGQEETATSSQYSESNFGSLASVPEYYTTSSPNCRRRQLLNESSDTCGSQNIPSQKSFHSKKKEKIDNVGKRLENNSILCSFFTANPSHSPVSVPSTSSSGYQSVNLKSSPCESYLLQKTSMTRVSEDTMQLLDDPIPSTYQSATASPTNSAPLSSDSGQNGGYSNTDPQKVGFDIKEEPLDCSQGSQRTENLVLSHDQRSILDDRNTTDSFGISKEALPTGIQEKFSSLSSVQASLLQEENAENGAGESDRPFVCPICRKSFAKAAILKRHHLAHFRPYGCHLCLRSFTRREVLAEHVLEHNGADLRLPCPVCHMTIKRKRNLQAHIKVKHPEYYQKKTSSSADSV